MPEITRRHALTLFHAGFAAAGVATATASPATQPSTPEERVAFHAGELAKAMQDIDPAKVWRATINHEHNFALVCGHDDIAQIDTTPVYDEPGFYEVELLNGRRPILWVERHGNNTLDGYYYLGAHRWRGNFETAPRKFGENQIRFIRKIESYGRA